MEPNIDWYIIITEHTITLAINMSVLLIGLAIIIIIKKCVIVNIIHIHVVPYGPVHASIYTQQSIARDWYMTEVPKMFLITVMCL